MLPPFSRVKFSNFFFADRPWLWITVKGCKKVISFYSVNKNKINFLLKFKCRDGSGWNIKSAVVTAFGRAAETFFTFELNVW